MPIDCLNSSLNESSSAKFDISNECAMFDFYVYTIVVGLMCTLGMIGNALSFIAMHPDSARSATSFLLQALAVADTLVLLASLPLYVLPPIYAHTGHMRAYYELYISILPFLWPIYLIPYTGTIFLTVLVSVNRYEAVCRPFNTAKLCGNDKVRRHVVYIAVFSVLYNIPRFFEYEKAQICVGYNVSREVFEISPFGGNTIYRIVYANVLYFVVMLGGPLVSLAFLNAQLIRALKRQAKRRTEMRVSSAAVANGGSAGGNQTDVTLVLVVVVFVFISCQTPTFVDHILWTVVDESRRSCGEWHYYYTAIGDMLAILNSSVNFVIYVLTSPKFRHSLASICVACLPVGASATASTIVARVRRRGRKDGTNAAAMRTSATGLCGSGSGDVEERAAAAAGPHRVDGTNAETILLYRPMTALGNNAQETDSPIRAEVV